MIPTLTTERLILRAPGPQDIDPFAAFYATDASKHVGGPLNEAETWRYLCQVIGHWSLRGYGRWMVTRKDDDAAIGLVGLHNPYDWPEPEVGWYIWSGLGQGFASEAGRAARDYAYGTLGWTTVMSMIAPGNDASVRVAEAMGAVREQDHDHPRHGRLMIYRHPGPEAAAP
ncbi:GNAT family N-acetyltransferase [uncultured Tateyamaria sp.]|uniref:GNAT family N-acetyltransferase n=1 Tax=uncultured Tateyamaria sp. TaxID=455651 RepID=UPI00260B1211|nr:GNAT family N-acetyltransferase [uncultured Tateyamaria sp.]